MAQVGYPTRIQSLLESHVQFDVNVNMVANGWDTMLGPMLGIIVIIVLNALFIWLALALRRHIQAIATPADPAQSADTCETTAEPDPEQHENACEAEEQLIKNHGN